MYKITVKGENYDSEFGTLINMSESCRGTYGDALNRGEMLLGLLDEGLVSIEQDKDYVSNCCNATVYNGICSECGEHCEEVEQGGLLFVFSKVFGSVNRLDLTSYTK